MITCRHILFITILVCSTVLGAINAVAVATDRVWGFPPNTEITIPGLDISGMTNDDGAITGLDLVCEEDSKHAVQDASGQPLKDKDGNDLFFVCVPWVGSADQPFGSDLLVPAGIATVAVVGVIIASGDSGSSGTDNPVENAPPVTDPPLIEPPLIEEPPLVEIPVEEVPPAVDPPSATFDGNYPSNCSILSDPGGHGSFVLMSGTHLLEVVDNGSFSMSANAPFIACSGTLDGSDNFTCTGSGTAAGIPGVMVSATGNFFNGTGEPGTEIQFELRVGSNGALPGGQAISYNCSGSK
ncbi:MAG: hypothetical protein R8M38_05935 [Mariprofundaceae bacterium]